MEDVMEVFLSVHGELEHLLAGVNVLSQNGVVGQSASITTG